MRRVILSVLLLAVTAASTARGADDPRAMEVIRRLGGTGDVDLRQKPDRPVIGLFLCYTDVTDADLAALTRLPAADQPLFLAETNITDAGLANLAGADPHLGTWP